MKAFLKDKKGAVTVFVTLLLIPAMLISGTAVDLARIYTARSIIQDANQLAANSMLSQYNALLHDLYGVFGIAENDPILAEMIDEYISVSVFGESSRDKNMGTLQLFYGSNINLDEVYFEAEKNLRNPDVLRQQIEEYMKFRGPIIIVKELLDLLGSSTFKEDSAVIDDKLKVDEGMAELFEKYKELYDAIIAADKCDQVNGGIAGASVGTVSSSLKTIQEEFADLKACIEEWEDGQREYEKKLEDAEDSEEEIEPFDEEEYISRCYEIINNIKYRTIGGKFGQGLNKTIENAKVNVDKHKLKFDKVVELTRQIDNMQTQLAQKVEELEQRINGGECNEELVTAMAIERGDDGKTMIERYRSILKWENTEKLAVIYKDSGYHYIDVPVKDLLDSVMYRNRLNSSKPSLTRTQLENVPFDTALLKALGSYSSDDVSYKMPEGFLEFGEHPGDNEEFFRELKAMIENARDAPPVALYEGQEAEGGGDSEDKQRNLIDDLMQLVDSAYAGITNNPLGAKHINGGSSGDDTSAAGRISESAQEAKEHNVSDVISNPGGSILKAADYVLLLTYCTSMFSNYTTARPEINGKKMDEIDDINFPRSISDVPISPEVNYFFHSEWEYLYNGDENAGKNLNAVSRLIYLIRMICNYITVFSVKEVTAVVNAIRSAFAFSGPLSIVLGELARAAFVAAESTIDLATLRAGYKVALIKSGKNGEWICSPSGLVTALKNVSSEIVTDEGEDDESDEKGISYSHYLLFFFIAKRLANPNATDELTLRTADLIEWNVINYGSSVQCDEEKMAEILSEDSRFKMESMKTDFYLTTTVDMRMLFLSMFFAQDFSDSRGIGMPHTVQVQMTDYRGY